MLGLSQILWHENFAYTGKGKKVWNGLYTMP